METRICDVCRIEFPLSSDFFYVGKNAKGLTFRRKCKNCYNKGCYDYQKKRVSKEAATSMLICNDCGKETNSLSERNYCAACEEAYRLYFLETEKELKEFAEEKAAEKKDINEWYEGLKGQLFHCHDCGKDKPIEEMKVAKTRKYVTKRCKPCENVRNKEYKEMYKANIFVKVLEKRRERQNDENTN